MKTSNLMYKDIRSLQIGKFILELRCKRTPLCKSFNGSIFIFQLRINN